MKDNAGVSTLQALLKKPGSLIMGVVNTTPDSFSDGGQFLDPAAAIHHGLALVDQGADILDIGGESTRPGAQEISVDEEVNRVIPVIEALTERTSTPISVDTSKPQVMRAALGAGAAMINDVNALRSEGALEVVAQTSALVCLMHMQGQPRTMQIAPVYDNVVADVIDFLQQRIDDCKNAGIHQKDILIDPGIGFGKSLDHNLSLLKHIPNLIEKTSCDVLVGVSRKSLIDSVLGRSVDQRLAGSLGLAVQSVLNGAKIVRVHDVLETHDAIRCVEAVNQASN